MTESYSDFVDACILKELSSHFELQFSEDKMFANIPFYLDLRTVFRRNGYSVHESETSFVVKRGNEKIASYDMGLFGAPWINLWAQDSGIEGVSGFPIGFSRADAKSKQGKLAEFSPRLIEEQKELDITAAQSDCKAIELFASDEIKRQEFDEEGRPKIEPFAGLYKLGGIQVLGKFEFIEEDEEGGPNTIQFYEVDDDGALVEAPFYYAIDMRRRNKVVKNIPANWLKVIRELALSYNYDSTTGVLYVSNTIGASYGFPPTAKHLQLSRLDLKIEDWDSPADVAQTGDHPGEPSTQQKQDIRDGATWVDLVNQFMNNPTKATYQQFERADSVKAAFEEMNKLAEYKMGTNNRTQTGEIRRMMLGQERSKTYEEYAKMVQEHTTPKGPDYFLIILFRLKGLVRNTADGKVYYDKC